MWDLALSNANLYHAPYGAKNHTSDYLMTLEMVCKTLPAAPNNAYYFDSNVTGHVVLDVEPDCPDELKEIFLHTNYVYGELSMSGRGYHLIYKTPDCLSKYPDAKKKIKMQDPHRKFEFLMEHYVTFTRNMLPPSDPNAPGIDAYFEQLCAMQQNTEKKFDFNVDIERPENIPRYDMLIAMLKANCKYKKTVEDFGRDRSRYEFGYAATMYQRLKRILSQSKGHEYTQTEQAWLLYDVLVEKIPYRDKHDTIRDGMPWLLYVIREMMAKNADSEPNAPLEKPQYPAGEDA